MFKGKCGTFSQFPYFESFCFPHYLHVMRVEKQRLMNRGIAFLLAALFLFSSCKETQSAVSCPGASDNTVDSKSGDSKKHHVSKRQKKAKGQDGFVPKDRKAQRSARKAEKGKKKERKETKVERKWHLLRKKREAKNDVSNRQKGNSKRNERKQQKLKKKRLKHPQNGNPPRGQV